MKRWKEFLPLYFYTSWAGGMSLAAALTGKISLLKATILILLGIISWGFVEYGLHRFIFHYDAQSQKGKDLLQAMHLSHHDDPKALDQLFASMKTSVMVASAYCLFMWAITGSWQVMAFLFSGLIMGYFAYEILHYQAHHYTPKLRVLQYLKKYHMLHHHQSSQTRFGVTTPVIDYLFGTFQPITARKTSMSSVNRGISNS